MLRILGHSLLLVYLVLSVPGCARPKIDILNRSKSPDSKYEAVAFVVRSGGGPGQVNWFVDVYPADHPPKALMPGDVDESIFYATHIQDLRVRWDSDTTLAIVCDCSGGRIWRTKQKWERVQIKVESGGQVPGASHDAATSTSKGPEAERK